MTEFTGEVRTIPHNDKIIYEALSDLRNLDKVKDQIPQEKIKDFSYDKDSCTLSVDPVGNVKFNIIEREPDKLIKFEAAQVPFPLNMWVQLKSVSENETKIKVTVKAELNVFLKPMVSKPIQQAVDKITEMLASLPYEKASE